jgi:hypothetical protein
MTSSRFCADGGLLVESRTRLPSDPCEYYRPDARILVGCNRLRCERCNEPVRSEPDLSLKPNVPADPAVLYASESWRDLPFIRRSSEVRLYTCRCTTWLAANNNSIVNDHDSPTDPNVPWSCAGHPVPELPVTLGELTIGVDTDFAQVVEKILAGACPRALQSRPSSLAEGPSLWLGWLYAYLARLPLADHLSSAIGERIDDPDPVTVGRALCFFLRFPRAVGFERVVARAEVAPERIAVGYPIPEYYDALTVWDVLVARLDQRSKAPDALDERTTDVVRKVLLMPLSSLSHEDVGPTDLVEIERQRLTRLGWDVKSGSGKERLDEYALSKKRVDNVVNTFKHVVTKAFDDADLRLWIADNIVKLDAAAKGRWRQYMDLLTDWYRKPELGHLIVIAGMRLIEGHVVGGAEFREWMKGLRANHGWVDDAWVFPLTSVLDEQKPPAN